MRSRFTFVLILIIATFAWGQSDRTELSKASVGPLCPPNGALDTAFNGTGMVTTPIGAGDDRMYATALQSDGKIVAAGYVNVGSIQFALARYHADGSLDTSFDGTGKVMTPVLGTDDKAFAVALQTDGKIVAAGAAKNSGQDNYDFAVVRYNGDGTLDTTWGGTGKVTTAISTTYLDRATSVAIQADGRVVVAGYEFRIGGDNTILVRYNPDGTLDTSFGGTGIVNTNVGVTDQANAVVIQTDGKIVSGGTANGGFALVRYNVDGSLDTSFGGDGIVLTSFPFGSGGPANSLAIQSDGRIVAAGYVDRGGAGGPMADFAVVRYNTDGTRDTSWGENGRALTTLTYQNDFAYGVAIQADGKVVVAGSIEDYHDFAVVRYRTNGTLDPSWGGTGKVITSVSSSYDAANSVLIQPDGKIIAGGNSFNGGNYDFALVRYSGCGVRTGFDFDDDQRADVSVFRPSSGVWYLLQSTAGFAAVPYGLSTDTIVPADFDGDRKTDIAVYRPANSTWYWINSSDGTFNGLFFGSSEDVPTPADYDGDGMADQAIYRPSTGTFWYAASSFFRTHRAIPWGTSTDVPVPDDYDGDGKADAAVFRPSEGTWYILNSSNGAFAAIPFGLSTDLRTQADFDGDSKADVAVYRSSTGIWYWLNSSDGAFNAAQFGTSEDQPVAADYDGDGQADIAVFRPSSGVWYRLNSSNSSFVAVQFGTEGDLPTPAAFRY